MRNLPDYEEQTISGVCYKVHSVFTGNKDLRQLLQSAVVDQVVRHLEAIGDTSVTKALARLFFPTYAAVAATIAIVIQVGNFG